MLRLLATLLIACSAVCAAPAMAQDIDLDAMDSAASLQADAIAAAVDGRWDEAKSLAIRALEQEASITTAQARLVLARAHEALGELDAAQRQVDNYLALPLLDGDRKRGDEVSDRIRASIARRDRAERPPGDEPEPIRAERPPPQRRFPLEVRQQRAGGIGLLAGGAAPTVVGIWFVATDVKWQQAGVESGTWAAIGAPVLITGLALEALGAVLLATAPNASKRRVRVSATVVPRREGVAFGLTGRF
ncbi:MAG: hypothetical protein KDA24_27290 [Deltaproteobacteria bacterium]|nr:hypothetical protein [Deltaproteobacteria bacterium]